MKEQYLECGRITSTHGVRGAVMIESWCDSPEILCGVTKLWYKKKDEYIPLEVTKASVHKGRVLAQFYGVDSIEEASLLKNRVVYADREDLPVGEDRVFVADMLVCPSSTRRPGTRSACSRIISRTRERPLLGENPRRTRGSRAGGRRVHRPCRRRKGISLADTRYV